MGVFENRAVPKIRDTAPPSGDRAVRRVLLADRDEAFRNALASALRGPDSDVSECPGAAEALSRLKRERFDLILTDATVKGMSRPDVLREIRSRLPEAVVVIVTDHGSIEGAVEAMRCGAQDYIERPSSPGTILQKLAQVLRPSLGSEADGNGHAGAATDSGWTGLVGKSREIAELNRLIVRVAPSESTVLIRGETGTGKELVARAIHRHSPRRDAPFIAINCSAIPETLLESLLFGHVRGAFTGADRDRQGFFESAGEGTIFLDEIGEMPLTVQPKLLRALDVREFLPLGSTAPLSVRARVVVATNRDLKSMVESGGFRQDLYFRLSTVEVPIAPLRTRPEDIELTAQFLIHRAAREMNRPAPSLSPAALSALESYHWPGNVRELGNVLERALIMSHGPTIEATDLPKHLTASVIPTTGSLKAATRAFERMFAGRVVDACDGDKVRAAKMLQISLPSLYRKLSPGKSVKSGSD
jgi:DNA-binding NtrC family response regulator